MSALDMTTAEDAIVQVCTNPQLLQCTHFDLGLVRAGVKRLAKLGMVADAPGMSALDMNTAEDAIVQHTREVVDGMVICGMEVQPCLLLPLLLIPGSSAVCGDMPGICTQCCAGGAAFPVSASALRRTHVECWTAWSLVAWRCDPMCCHE